MCNLLGLLFSAGILNTSQNFYRSQLFLVLSPFNYLIVFWQRSAGHTGSLQDIWRQILDESRKSEISCTSTWYVSRRQLQALRPSRGARDNPKYCAEISPAQDQEQEQEQEQDAAFGQGFAAHECSFTTSEGTITITTTTTTASVATAAAATTRRRLVMLRFVPLRLGWANCSSSSSGTWHHRALGPRHVAAACQVDLHIPFWRIPRHAPKASASGKMRRRNHPKVEVSPQSAAAGDQFKTQFHGRYGLHLDEGRGNLNINNSNNKRSHTMVVDLL